MVKFIVKGKESTDQKNAYFGFASFDFDLLRVVENARSKGFDVTTPSILDNLGPLLPPGLPDLPPGQGVPGLGLPEPENPIFQYFGKNLKFKDITLLGHTIKTPQKGRIDRYFEEGDDYSITVTGIGVKAADFFKVTKTAGIKDNKALVREIFDGNDTLKGGALKDKFNGFDGADKITGGNGNDVLFGGNGKDNINGGKGKDLVNGGAGNDILKGGKSADTFEFAGGKNGVDRIKDFEVDLDHIKIKHKSVDEFDDLTIKGKSGNAIITYADTRIVLEDVGKGQLDAGDFLI